MPLGMVKPYSVARDVAPKVRSQSCPGKSSTPPTVLHLKQGAVSVPFVYAHVGVEEQHPTHRAAS